MPCVISTPSTKIYPTKQRTFYYPWLFQLIKPERIRTRLNWLYVSPKPALNPSMRSSCELEEFTAAVMLMHDLLPNVSSSTTLPCGAAGATFLALGRLEVRHRWSVVRLYVPAYSLNNTNASFLYRPSCRRLVFASIHVTGLESWSVSWRLGVETQISRTSSCVGYEINDASDKSPPLCI